MAHILDPANHKFLRTADGTNYSYVAVPAQSNKPTFLLLHGFPDTSYDWRHLLPLLRSTGAGVIAPDLLGYALTDRPTDPAAYRPRRIAGHVVEIVDREIGAESKVICLAHDAGCNIQSHLHGWWPQRVLAYISLSLLYFPPGTVLETDAVNAVTKDLLGYECFGYFKLHNRDDAHLVYEQHHERVQRIFYSEDPSIMIPAFAVEGGAEAYFTGSQELPPLASYITQEELDISAKLLLDGGYTGPLNWYKCLLRGLSAEDDKDVTEEMKIVKEPFLWIATAKDPICVPRAQTLGPQAYLEDLTTVELDSAHWVMLERPQETFEAIVKFVSDKLSIEL